MPMHSPSVGLTAGSPSDAADGPAGTAERGAGEETH